MVSSSQLTLVSKIADSHDRINCVEALDKRRHNAKNRWLSYQKWISRAYNKEVRPWAFTIGDLVLEAAGHIQKGISASNFAAKWEGPDVVRKAYDNCYFLISNPILMNA